MSDNSKKTGSFLDELLRRTLIGDGAMGTLLYQKGVFVNSCFDELSLTNKPLVEGCHDEYIQAGADFIETNTFGANAVKLGRFGLSDKTELINRSAVEIARRAAGDCFVGGAIGPLGVDVAPQGAIGAEHVREIFARQAAALLEGGVDFLIFETFTNPTELLLAIDGVRVLTDIPIVAQMTFADVEQTPYGHTIQDAIDRVQRIDAVKVVGLNCSLGPSQMLSLVDKIKDITDKPIAIQPNAGFPQEVDGRSIYMSTPEYMAEYAKRFFEKGVRLIGGCCGTTPAHIREMARAVKGLDRAMAPGRHKHTIRITRADRAKGVEPIPFAQKSELAAKLASGQKIITIEISPPKGVCVTKLLDRVRQCAACGIDAINIPDGPRASSRLSAFATAIKIQQAVPIEVMLHVCCRDKNLIAMQSDMLGIQALGLKNVLLVTGDPPKLGDYPNATAVYDLDSVALTAVVSDLNRGLDIAQNTFDPPLSLVAGVGVNPVAVDMQREIDRLKQKADAGAEFAVSQPVFDSDGFLRFMDKISGIRLPVIAGIWPLTSYKNAEFMANEVPGVFLPDAILQRMKACQDRPQAVGQGIAVAREMVAAIADRVAGYAVSAPFGNVNIALAVMGKKTVEDVL